MADYEHRLKHIRGHVKDAYDELHALPAEERAAYETGLARLDEVVAHAGVVLDATDARLISTTAFTSIQSAASTISNDPRAALEAADACADALLDSVALLPVQIEHREDVDAEAKRLHALRSELDAWTADMRRQSEKQAAMDKKLAEVEQTITARSAECHAGIDGFRSELARAQQLAFDEVEERVAEIRGMVQENAKLVDTLALAGTTELYREQGHRQRRAAGILRGLTVLAALGAVAVAGMATVATEPTAESLIATLFASLLLAGLAAYFAGQSAWHRAREGQASALELELAAFSPFIESLTPEQREEERVVMTRKLFGRTAPPAPSEGDHAPLSFLLRRRHRETVLDEPDGIGESWSLGSVSPSPSPERALERSGNGAGSNGSPPL